MVAPLEKWEEAVERHGAGEATDFRLNGHVVFRLDSPFTGNIFHVTGSCMLLWVFGRRLERLLGWKLLPALVFPFLGVVSFLVQWTTDPASLTVITARRAPAA